MLDTPIVLTSKECSVILDYIEEMLVLFENEEIDMTTSTTGVPLTKEDFTVLYDKFVSKTK